MSMLHTVLAARLSAFRAAAGSLWPAGTTFRPGDVLVDGLSLTARLRDEGTPAVCVAPAAEGWVDPVHEPTLRTVVLTRVTGVVGGRHRQVWLDADLDACTPVLRAALLLGRVSRTPSRPWAVRPVRRGTPEEAFLPTDLGPGDLVAIPCLGLVTPREIAP